MDGRNHICIRTDIILNAGNRLCIGKQTFHFGLGAAVAEFQVVQHRIVLLGKSLVCVLDESDIRTHLIGIIRHIGNGHIRILYCRLGISSKGRNKGGRKRCDRGHIVVCRHTRRLIGVVCIFLQCSRGILKQRIDTADQLLIFCVGFNHCLAKGNCGGSGSRNHRSHCHTDAF